MRLLTLHEEKEVSHSVGLLAEYWLLLRDIPVYFKTIYREDQRGWEGDWYCCTTSLGKAALMKKKKNPLEGRRH